MTPGDPDDVDVAIMVAAAMKWRKEVEKLSRQVTLLRGLFQHVERLVTLARNAHLDASKRGSKPPSVAIDLELIRKAARKALDATEPEA